MAGSDNRRKFERIPMTKPVEMSMVDGMQKGEIRDISVGGAAIISRGPLQIGLGEPVELRVENFEKVSGHVVRASGDNGFAIVFDIDEKEARQIVDDITKDF